MEPLMSIPPEAHELARARETYASFGDGQGVTASANAHGHLIQISRYFGGDTSTAAHSQPSGFFCVDLNGTAEPYFVVSRAGDLRDYSSDPSKGMRLDPGNFKHDNEEVPRMAFLQDRWPNFSIRKSIFDSVQYLISDSTVYQIYRFSQSEPSLSVSDLSDMSIMIDLLIRDLDFINFKFENESNRYTSIYDTIEGQNCVIGTRKIDITELKMEIAVYITPFINGQPAKLRRKGNYQYGISVDKDSSDDLSTRALEVALAYTLKQIPSDRGAEHRQAPVSGNDLARAKKITTETQHKPLQLSQDPHLNFVLRRNLEHILSVCSIPAKKLGDEPHPVALTCGDIAGHRVATAASFYAFQFLLLGLKYLTSDPRPPELTCACIFGEGCCNVYACNLRDRIWRVCLGHLKWICMKPEGEIGVDIGFQSEVETIDEARPSHGEGCLPPHRWANGEIISGWEQNAQLPRKSLSDTAFQIIKAGEFCRVVQDESVHGEIAKGFGPIVTSWIQEIDQQNQNGQYAFPSSRDDITYKFYLADHALIWWAIKSAELLGLERTISKCLDSELSPGSKKRKYSSHEVHNYILKRFTLENHTSRSRMLAVSRSPFETRFLLRIKDSVVFHAMDLGLFDSFEASNTPSTTWESKVDVWRNTVACQVHHEDNQDDTWDHPLRFALSLILTAKGKPINSRSVSQMHHFAKLRLLQSSSPNGLLPGRFDDSGERAVFKNETVRDNYWYATFELPYILWRYSKPHGDRHEAQNGLSTDTAPLESLIRNWGSNPAVDNTKVISGDSQVLSQALEKIQLQLNSISSITTLASLQHKDGSVMKHSSPFSNRTDRIGQRNIVELSDEWLYKEPEFFTSHPDLSHKAIVKFCDKTRYDSYGSVLDDAIVSVNEAASRDPRTGLQMLLAKHGQLDIVITDVPREKRFSKQNTNVNRAHVNSNERLRQIMDRKRTATNAKKRLLQLFRWTPETALICCMASAEGDEISFFVHRHASYDKHFSEDVKSGLNKWVTELHLSFYQIVHHDTPTGSVDKSASQGINLGDIKQAVMSFRFDGDFFDRYWTCHYAEDNPRSDRPTDTTEWQEAGTHEARPWRQRKVFELILFERILQEMIICTKEILDEAKKSVLKSPRSSGSPTGSLKPGLSVGSDVLNLLSGINNDEFISTSRAWSNTQHILQVVQEDMGENLAVIELWMNREKEREPDQPRWTLNDERRYRSAISKLLVSNSHRIRELHRTHANISSFNMSLANKLENTRSDLELQGADDIRLFTYVTAIFLPIGFATGVFSMSEAPTWRTLVGMIATAAVALFLTLVALIIAKVPTSRITQWLRPTRRFAISRSPRKSENISVSGVDEPDREYLMPWSGTLMEKLRPQGNGRRFNDPEA